MDVVKRYFESLPTKPRRWNGHMVFQNPMGYTEIEVIPVEAIQILENIKALPNSERKKFHDLYLDYVEQQDWERLSEATLDWDEDQDDYSDVLQR